MNAQAARTAPARWALPAVLIVAGAALPFVVRNGYYQQVIVDGYIAAIAVYGLNVILGYAGQLSLGHAAFFGIGAYAVALLTTKANMPFWPALLIGCAISAFAGYLVGLVSLRTKGHYFAIFTAAVGVMISIVFTNWQALTNGAIGIVNIPSPAPIGPLSFDGPEAKYELVYAGLLIAIGVAAALRHSATGRTWLALAQNEDLARAVGIDVTQAKRLAFAVSTTLAGFAGGLYATFIGFLGPDSTGVDRTFEMLLYLIVGGLGTIAGPLVGTLGIVWLTQSLQVFEKYQMLLFGPFLVVLIAYFPGGIAGAVDRVRHGMRRTPGPERAEFPLPRPADAS